MIILYLALVIVEIASMWVLFTKAGEEGWKSIVPFYNVYTLCKITWGNGLYFLAMFVPIVNVVIVVMTMIKLATAFGKGGGFACGLVFLSFIFIPILAFGDATYSPVAA